MKKIIIAYGNPDRQDDGAGWVVLDLVSTHFGRKFTDYNDDFYSCLGHDIDFLYVLQLIPELVDTLANYDAVAFVDAGMVGVGVSLHITAIQPQAIISPLSHHLTPQALLAYLDDTHQQQLDSWLITIPGYSFGFSRQLTDRTLADCAKAAEWLIHWINH